MLKLKLTLPIFFLTTSAVAYLVVTFTNQYSLPLLSATAAVGATAVIFAIDQKWGLFSLLLIRSSLDIFNKDFILSLGSFRLNPASLLGVLVAVISVFHFLNKYRKFPANPTIKFFIAFLGYSLFTSFFFSINPIGSFQEWVRLFDFFIIFALMIQSLNSIEDIRKLVRVIGLSAVIPAGVATYQYFTEAGLSVTPGFEKRVFGTFAHSNLYAFYLVLLTTLLLVTYLNSQSLIKKNILLFLITIFSALLILTFTRGAWIGFVASLLVIIILKYRKLTVILPVIFVLVMTQIPQVAARINQIIHWREDTAFMWRIWLWQETYWLILKSPLLGYGLDSFGTLTRNLEGYVTVTHNDYLKVALENGIIGLMFYLGILLSLFFSAFKLFKQTKERYFKSMSVGFLGFLSAYFVMSSADNILQDTAMQWYFWAYAAIIYAAFKITEVEKNRPHTSS